MYISFAVVYFHFSRPIALKHCPLFQSIKHDINTIQYNIQNMFLETSKTKHVVLLFMCTCLSYFIFSILSQPTMPFPFRRLIPSPLSQLFLQEELHLVKVGFLHFVLDLWMKNGKGSFEKLSEGIVGGPGHKLVYNGRKRRGQHLVQKISQFF